MSASVKGYLRITWGAGLLACLHSAEAQPVPEGYRQVAQEYRLPPALFYAVALTESGQSGLSSGFFRPWPWTLNINGVGYYFTTRRQAWRKLQAILSSHDSSVDIGLMQINWRYHHADLVSPWRALEPFHNLKVAADILRACYQRHATWSGSVGCYHAPNDSVRAQAYTRRVKQHWVNIDDHEQEAWVDL
jgi:Transglycosylase SLT domain